MIACLALSHTTSSPQIEGGSHGMRACHSHPILTGVLRVQRLVPPSHRVEDPFIMASDTLSTLVQLSLRQFLLMWSSMALFLSPSQH